MFCNVERKIYMKARKAQIIYANAVFNIKEERITFLISIRFYDDRAPLHIGFNNNDLNSFLLLLGLYYDDIENSLQFEDFKSLVGEDINIILGEPGLAYSAPGTEKWGIFGTKGTFTEDEVMKRFAKNQS